MSRSKNSRRGTRQKMPPFLAAEMQEMRDLNIARIGAPKAGDARRVQAAARALAENVKHEPEICDCPSCSWADNMDEFSCLGCGRPCWWAGRTHLEADNSLHDWQACVAAHRSAA